MPGEAPYGYCRRTVETPLSVLVVENDPDCREAIADYLEICGYGAATAGDGQEALRTLRSRPLPDVVLADLRMPSVGGEELIAEIRRDARLAGLPVVVMTGDLWQERPAGAVAIVHKPFSPDELLAVLERVIEAPGAPVRVVG